jgi:hypothetical protein
MAALAVGVAVVVVGVAVGVGVGGLVLAGWFTLVRHRKQA